ncbi:MAG: hypothetical protein V3U08_06285 [Nitrospirales bacterium]
MVNPISQHGNNLSFILETSDLACLLLREHFGLDAIDLYQVGDRACRPWVVAGQHGDL